MDNKEVWISVAIVIVLLALGVYLTQKTSWFESTYNYSDFEDFDGGFEDFPVECNVDSDCVKVQEGCCSCSSGGNDICIAKSLEKAHATGLEKCDEAGTFCAQVFNCKINSCICVNGICEGN